MCEPWSPEWKQEQLDNLYRDWSKCVGCTLHRERACVVFGEGNPDADIVIVGSSPGPAEDESGRPFVGRSGDYINSLLGALGVVREDIYITNVVMCMPPDNRDPTKLERDTCRARLLEQIYLIDPMGLILMGSVAMKSLAGSRHKSVEASIKDLRLTEVEIPGRRFPIKYDAVITYHPAHILRNDIIDPKTGSWREKGPSDRTFKAVNQMAELVELLNNQYNTLR